LNVASSPEGGRCSWLPFHYTSEVSKSSFEMKNREKLHVKPYDLSLRIISVAIAFAGSVEEILDPQDVIEPSTRSGPKAI